MPLNPVNTDSSASQFKHRLSEVRDQSVEDIIGITDRTKAEPLQEVRAEVEGMLALADELAEDLPLESVPVRRLDELYEILKEGTDALADAYHIDSTENKSRDEIVADIREQHRKWHSVFTPLLAYYRSSEPQRVIEEKVREAESTVQDRLDDMEEVIDKRTKDLQRHERDAENIVQNIQSAAEVAGIATHEKWFKEAAEEAEARAEKWLGVAVALAVVTLVTAVMFLVLVLPVPEEWTVGQSLQIAVTKVLLLAVLVSATVWAGTMYRANTHNYVVNKHRQNALKTFRAFGDATSGDPETKRAVLIQATRSIFAPQESGYLKTASGSYEGGSQVMEILRSGDGES